MGLLMYVAMTIACFIAHIKAALSRKDNNNIPGKLVWRDSDISSSRSRSLFYRFIDETSKHASSSFGITWKREHITTCFGKDEYPVLLSTLSLTFMSLLVCMYCWCIFLYYVCKACSKYCIWWIVFAKVMLLTSIKRISLFYSKYNKDSILHLQKVVLDLLLDSHFVRHTNLNYHFFVMLSNWSNSLVWLLTTVAEVRVVFYQTSPFAKPAFAKKTCVQKRFGRILRKAVNHLIIGF